MQQKFRDREDAGQQLAGQLLGLRDADVVVFGLPRGGVPVAAEVASTLHAPLGVILVAKLGVPFQPEVAMGAIAEGGIRVVDERYYRAMVRTDRGSWNIRDTHMADTVGRLATRFGPRSKGLVWEHNTHVGDARATSMAAQGLVNVGQLLRERYGSDDVLLVGFAGHRGDVLAGTQWGAGEQRMAVPPARAGSHEALLHEAGRRLRSRLRRDRQAHTSVVARTSRAPCHRCGLRPGPGGRQLRADGDGQAV